MVGPGFLATMTRDLSHTIHRNHGSLTGMPLALKVVDMGRRSLLTDRGGTKCGDQPAPSLDLKVASEVYAHIILTSLSSLEEVSSGNCSGYGAAFFQVVNLENMPSL